MNESAETISNLTITTQEIPSSQDDEKKMLIEKAQIDIKESFSNELLDNPPLNKKFSPKVELERIRKLPKYLKKEALQKFKDKFTRQERAWAHCYQDIKTLISSHPDVSKLELVNFIKKYSKKYFFDKAQIATAEEYIDNYLNHHSDVKKIREQYPNDRDLIQYLIERDLNPASFNVSIGPMSIDIETTDRKTAGLIVDYTDKEQFKTIKAFKTILKSIPVTVVVKNLELSQWVDINHVHERQHVLYEIFKEARQRYDTDLRRNIFRACLKKHDPDIKNRLIHWYLSISIKFILDEAADEILAQKKVENELMFVPDQNGDCDFTKNNNYDFWTRHMLPSNYEKLGISQDQINNARKEYAKGILSASSTFDKLRVFLNISTDQVIGLLINYPVADWPKIASRQIESHHARNLNDQNKTTIIPKFLQNYTSLIRLKKRPKKY